MWVHETSTRHTSRPPWLHEIRNVKRFGQAYFDKWYRNPAHRVGTPADLARQIQFTVSAAEYLLARPIRSVLDVGCGEGRWEPVVRRLRPKARYTGVDPSDYVLRRFGTRRNIQRGTFSTLGQIGLTGPFDLIVSCSVINYLPRDEVVRGLRNVAQLLGGLAYLEIFASTDDAAGDRREWYAESPAWYRGAFARAGLVSCGLHCYVGRDLVDHTVALEREQ